jgi:hypothetical protein
MLAGRGRLPGAHHHAVVHGAVQQEGLRRAAGPGCQASAGRRHQRKRGRRDRGADSLRHGTRAERRLGVVTPAGTAVCLSVCLSAERAAWPAYVWRCGSLR